MLGLKKKKKTEVEVKERKVEKPKINIEEEIEKIELRINEEGLEEYVKVAEEVNFNPPELIREKLLMYLVKEKIKIYKYDKVVQFMNNEYGADFRSRRSGWLWLKLSNKENGDYRAAHWFDGELSGGFCIATYQRVIPIDVLRKVKKLKEKNPNVGIFVS